MDKKLWLQGSDGERDRFISAWRAQAVNRVCNAFEVVKLDEMANFGDKSFFNRKARNLSPVVSDNDLDPSPEIEVV